MDERKTTGYLCKETVSAKKAVFAVDLTNPCAVHCKKKLYDDAISIFINKTYISHEMCAYLLLLSIEVCRKAVYSI